MTTSSVNSELYDLLKSYSGDFASIAPIDLKKERLCLLDLSVSNPEFEFLNMEQLEVQESFVWGKIRQVGAVAGIGGYGEKRDWYKRSENYVDQNEFRSIHLGIDLWMPEGTSIFAPLPGVIHSLNNNAGLGDYGPTIILQHQIEDLNFYSLYGHLSVQSLEGKRKGDQISKGQKFAEMGSPLVNGEWPAHVHFQLMTTMLGKEGDFPGVAAESDKDYWLGICPDPNLILGCPLL